ncbi:1,4-dihydroxy-2-naphthoate polyprenyltransferase [Nocardioides terrisoli]|uniref:1,4-dihydroxy-2-naphthoate polyprenyltransferase n=1 Tax=Nocardioides terrisoli TaxID=3388267 RepID=UPI00287BB568|nr:1,4-dihydroxy-2-naphthoate polyprenyltransferase [Nocardioides marmorisolisilvae]
MATPAQWVSGARPRTLPAAIAPVLAGTAVAAYFDLEVWWKAALALLVSLLLQVGVNYANDYSDGVRGTDDDRVGPMRLVGSGAATAAAVKRAALGTLALAAAVGLVLAATTAWWLVAVGALSILAAWFYTGGSKPYGYLGLGELMVFVFFGLVAVLGTVYVQVHHHVNGWFAYDPLPAGMHFSVWPSAWWAAVGVGALACAILVANNLRDIPTDREVGKRTLAVVLGDRRTRRLYVGLVLVAVVMLVLVALATTLAALVGLVALVPLGRASRTVLRGASGPGLVPVLAGTGAGELLYAAGAFIGLLVAR